MCACLCHNSTFSLIPFFYYRTDPFINVVMADNKSHGVKLGDSGIKYTQVCTQIR